LPFLTGLADPDSGLRAPCRRHNLLGEIVPPMGRDRLNTPHWASKGCTPSDDSSDISGAFLWRGCAGRSRSGEAQPESVRGAPGALQGRNRLYRLFAVIPVPRNLTRSNALVGGAISIMQAGSSIPQLFVASCLRKGYSGKPLLIGAMLTSAAV